MVADVTVTCAAEMLRSGVMCTLATAPVGWGGVLSARLAESRCPAEAPEVAIAIPTAEGAAPPCPCAELRDDDEAVAAAAVASTVRSNFSGVVPVPSCGGCEGGPWWPPVSTLPSSRTPYSAI